VHVFVVHYGVVKENDIFYDGCIWYYDWSLYQTISDSVFSLQSDSLLGASLALVDKPLILDDRAQQLKICELVSRHILLFIDVQLGLEFEDH